MTIAKSGAFSLGFVSLPAIFASMPLGNLLGFMWFFLLFFAGVTSSVAITQPIITFFEDEYDMSRTRSVLVTYLIIITSILLVVFIDKTIDEWDFWAGTIGVVVFGFVELVIFVWIFGSDKAWKEINRYGLIKAPRIFYYIIKYITPLFLITLIAVWGYEQIPGILKQTAWNVWIARIYIIGLLLFLTFLVIKADKKKIS